MLFVPLVLAAAAAGPPDSARVDSVRFPPGTSPISARYLPPAGATYVTVEMRVRTAERYSLAGTLVLPRRTVPNRERFPVVVMASDGGPHNRDHTPARELDRAPEESYRGFAEIADSLARLGVASLRLDDRGVSSSTGTLANADALDLTYDLRAALAALRQRSEIDPARIFALGLGEGALCAAMLGRFETDLAGLVLLSSPADRGRRVVEWRAGRDGAPGVGEWEKLVAADRGARFLDGYDPLGTAKVVRCPVLLVEGGADAEQPPGSAARLGEAFRAGGNRDVTVREHEGVDHRLVPATAGSPPRLSRVVLAEVAGWILARSGRPASGRLGGSVNR